MSSAAFMASSFSASMAWPSVSSVRMRRFSFWSQSIRSTLALKVTWSSSGICEEQDRPPSMSRATIRIM
uniref:Uncharacterized protein n=1 Tax=uncultured marine virus TaxID=186617 RepID=A0A0F7L0A8_9VIRU|nr:hypothetical protein [uncultured marine virus]